MPQPQVLRAGELGLTTGSPRGEERKWGNSVALLDPNPLDPKVSLGSDDGSKDTESYEVPLPHNYILQPLPGAEERTGRQASRPSTWASVSSRGLLSPSHPLM